MAEPTEIDCSVHILRTDSGKTADGATYILTVAPNPTGGGLPDRRIVGEDGLRSFLAGELDIHPPDVDAAIAALPKEGSHTIHHVLLTPTRIKKVWRSPSQQP